MFKLKMFGSSAGTILGHMIAGALFLASLQAEVPGPLALFGAIALAIGAGSGVFGGRALYREIQAEQEWRWKETVKRARADADAATAALQARPVPALPDDIDALYAAQEAATRELARQCAEGCQSLLEQQAAMRSRMAGLSDTVDHLNKDRDRLRKIAERAARARAAFDQDPEPEDYSGVRHDRFAALFPAIERSLLQEPPPLERTNGAASEGHPDAEEGRA